MDRATQVDQRSYRDSEAVTRGAYTLANSTGSMEAGEFTDSFQDQRQSGQVIGSTIERGVTRKGIDRERVMTVDNGALRIQPLTKSRWGRASVSYGPYQRQNGLAFGVSILNGHNTSQTGALPDSLRQRLTQWLRGSEVDAPSTRMRRWIGSRQRRYFARHLQQWLITGSKLFQGKRVDENLAVGWFPGERTHDPLGEGNAFIMHALGPECGELWARVGSAALRSVRGVQNVPIYYVVVLRERGAAYYAASVSGTPGFESYPSMTPMAIDPFGAEPTVYAGIHQSVLGQIGFRVDTRVYRTQVATLPAYLEWYGSAFGADRLTGEGSLQASPADTGGAWTVWEGTLSRTPNGLEAREPVNTAVLECPAPAGLLHLIVQTDDRPVEGVALLFRVKDRDNFFAFEVGTAGCSLLIVENGVANRLPSTDMRRLAPFAANSVQVRDDGASIRLYVNGELVYDTQLLEKRFNDGRGAGVHCERHSNAVLRDFEAHPRAVAIPAPLELGLPWQAQGRRVVVEDEFGGVAGDLEGHVTSSGERTWQRLVGTGEIRLTGDCAAKIHGSVQQPCPGRTAYALRWESTRFADVSVEITPPGTRKGVGERGRGGLIFYQDADNYITLSVFIDDWYGMSIAAFFHRDGYEELYDAVWSNIGKRIHWGMPYAFRVVFDSTQFMAYVNDEPVLYRALSDIYPDWNALRINHVGLVANWEWGSDTGSTFKHFVARDRE